MRSLMEEAVAREIAPDLILEHGLRKGLEHVGQKYELGEYFLSELLFAGSLVDQAMKILGPHLTEQALTEYKGIIVLGTVRGDIHDIGKNIFGMLAQASGFKLWDVGVDVDPEIFLEKIKEVKPDILALSALLTTTMGEMKTVIDLLTASVLRGKVRVILGGNAVNREFGAEIGADAVGLDAVEGVEQCKAWVKA